MEIKQVFDSTSRLAIESDIYMCYIIAKCHYSHGKSLFNNYVVFLWTKICYFLL